MEQLQPGRPPVGPSGQLGQLDRREGRVIHIAEELLHLPRAESERVAVDLHQVTRETEPREVEARLAAGGHHEDALPWEVARQSGNERFGR